MKRDLWKLGLFFLLFAGAAHIDVMGCYPVLAAAFMAVYLEDFHRGKILLFSYIALFLWLPVAGVVKYGVLFLIAAVGVLFLERMYGGCSRMAGTVLMGITVMLVSYGGNALQIVRLGYRWIPLLEGMMVFSLGFLGGAPASWLIQWEPRPRQREHPEERRLLAYADAMDGLSKSFSDMSRQPAAQPLEMGIFRQELTAKVCTDCGSSAVCTIKNGDMTGIFGQLLKGLYENGSVKENLTEDLRKRCSCPDEVIAEATRIFEKANLNMAWYNRLIENREMIAGQIDAMSYCLKDCITGEKQADEGKRQEIYRLKFALRERGLRPGEIHFYDRSDGTSRLTVEMRSGRAKYVPVKEILPLVGNCAGLPMDPAKNSSRYVGRERSVYTFVTRPALCCSYGVCRMSAEGYEVSGDNFMALEEPEGHYIYALSDGMGCGWQANRESETVLELLEQFLCAHFSMGVALRLMNAAMVFGGNGERYSTLDVCAVDGYTGICEFYKVGGHVSFLKHQRSVEVVADESLPMGAASGVDPKPWRGHLKTGDFLVMITDGVLEYLTEPHPLEVLKKQIDEMAEQDPQRFSEKLLEQVLQHTGGRISDDMTVLVVKTWET